MKCQLCCLPVCDVTKDTFLKCALLSSSPEVEKSELPPRICMNIPITVPEVGAMSHKLQGDCITILSMTKSTYLGLSLALISQKLMLYDLMMTAALTISTAS